MPQKSKFKLPPINLGSETIGQRIARLRKKQGFTQQELAKKIGIIQSIISEYENDNLRMFVDMAARFSLALNVTVDEIIGLKKGKNGIIEPNLRIMKRLKKIENLPKHKQKHILKTLDSLIRDAENS